MIDEKGRVWLAAAGRVPDNPAFCKKGSDHPSAKVFPLDQSQPPGRRCYDPKTEEVHLRRHLLPDRIICSSATTPTTRCGLERRRRRWSAGSTPRCSTRPATPRSRRAGRALVLDTNGNGKRDEYTEPGQPADPGKDRRIGAGFYAVMPSPTDGSVWGTFRGNPGAVVRIDPG